MLVPSITIIFNILCLVHASRIISCYFEYDQPKVGYIDPYICTHLFLIRSCTLNDQCQLVFPPSWQIQEISTLKYANSKLRLLITLLANNRCMSTIVNDLNLTSIFAKNVTDYLRENAIDGFDLDWEFPVWSSGSKSDRNGFTNLIKVLRNSFNNSKLDLLLTAAVAAPYTIVNKAYNVSMLNRYLDLVQIMNYDFHLFSKYTPITGLNAQLRPKRIETMALKKLNSDYSTQNWIKLGLSREKLVFGIPTYGRGYKLLLKFLHGIYAPAIGYSKFGQDFAYEKVCHLPNSSEYSYVYDQEAESPYIYGGDKQWLTLEDRKSMIAKASYARLESLRGIMLFDLKSDDYMNRCGYGTYPLIRAAKEAFMKSQHVLNNHQNHASQTAVF